MALADHIQALVDELECSEEMARRICLALNARGYQVVATEWVDHVTEMALNELTEMAYQAKRRNGKGGENVNT